MHKQPYILLTLFFFSVFGAYFLTSFLSTGKIGIAGYSFAHDDALSETAILADTPLPDTLVDVPGPILEVEPPAPTDYAQLAWTEATATAEWDPRDSAANFIFNGKMFIMGGLNGNVLPSNNHKPEYWNAVYFNDIWSSVDGEHWNLEVEHAAWSPRRSMSVVSHGGVLRMYGGWSPKEGYVKDVWKSVDGVHWEKDNFSIPWVEREGQIMEVFQDKAWLFGGVNYDTRVVFNDIWSSVDGERWELATTAPWSPRWDHAVAQLPDGALLLAGGMNLTGVAMGDVWITYDGLSWKEIPNTAWEPRQGHALVPFSDNVWLIGRLNDEAEGGLNTVWYTHDGYTWVRAQDPLWDGREDHTVMAFNNSIFVMGGMDKNWRWRNDVWKLTAP